MLLLLNSWVLYISSGSAGDLWECIGEPLYFSGAANLTYVTMELVNLQNTFAVDTSDLA